MELNALTALAPVDGRYRATASLLAPFAYVHIVISLVLGLLVFGAMPDAIALGGMTLIVGTGVAMALRQRRN